MKKKILEKDVESRLRKKVMALGFLCEKFTSPQRRSVPDRLVTTNGGRMYFVELKAPGKKPTSAQQRDHERRRAMGFEVLVIDSYEGVDAFIEMLKKIPDPLI
ncbi:MAG: VRR-NUC domain-containing protein [Desulfobacteraceae bacterium]|jgi:hypothetical protein